MLFVLTVPLVVCDVCVARVACGMRILGALHVMHGLCDVCVGCVECDVRVVCRILCVVNHVYVVCIACCACMYALYIIYVVFVVC